MKKNRTTLIILLILAIIALALLLKGNLSSRKSQDSQFSVTDTASITKLFFADKNNHTVKLTRQSNGQWLLNDQHTVTKQNIETMLITLHDLAVKSPIAKSAHNNTIRLLAATSVKTEIYQRVYRINWWKINLFPHEKCTKIFYVGEPTMDNIGTSMLMEGSETPYVVYIPTFRGFVASRFSCNPFSWRERNIFKTKLPDIKSVKVEFGETPDQSYIIENNNNNRNFEITSLYENKRVADFDTLKTINFMTSFRNINFESFNEGNISKATQDSIVKTVPAHIITLTNKMGKVFVVKTWRIFFPEGTVDETGITLKYDPDRMYALIYDGKEFVSVQYYVFDNITRPLAWFLDKSRKGPTFTEIN